MSRITAKLSVFFEEPFWIGVFEREEEGKLSVSRVVFGAEPKDYEVQAFLLGNFYGLKFSPSVDAETVVKESVNPKRLKREAQKQVNSTGTGTKSQQALQLQYEQMKQERKIHSKEQKEAEKQLQFEIKQQKRKEKHRGR